MKVKFLKAKLDNDCFAENIQQIQQFECLKANLRARFGNFFTNQAVAYLIASRENR